MRKIVSTAAALAALAASADVAAAQLPVPLAIEGRADLAVPLGDFADVADNGVGFGASVAVGLVPGFAVYGSYSHVSFGVNLADDTDADAVDSGWSAGVTASLPAGGARFTPYVGAGIVRHELDLDTGGEGEDDELGFEAAAGVAVNLGYGLRVTPAIGYRQYTAKVPVLLGTGDLDVRYLTAGVGVNLGF